MSMSKMIIDCTNKSTTILPLSAEEIEEREQESALYAEQKAQREAQEQALQALKTSVKAKLIAGEPLTEEEASVLVI